MSIGINLKPVMAYIGIGANLGDAKQQVQQALQSISHIAQCKLLKGSSLYSSAPVDAPANMHSPDFVNAVAQVQTTLSAQALLDALRHIETQAGRVRSTRNAPRTLDLDVLLYGDEVINTATLQVPHPRMHERAFVLLPLVEVAPDVLIPGVGKAASFVQSVSDQRLNKLAMT